MTKDVKKFIKNEFKRVVLIFKYFLKKKITIVSSIKTYKETLTKMSNYHIFSTLVQPLISADGHFFET